MAAHHSRASSSALSPWGLNRPSQLSQVLRVKAPPLAGGGRNMACCARVWLSWLVEASQAWGEAAEISEIGWLIAGQTELPGSHSCVTAGKVGAVALSGQPVAGHGVLPGSHGSSDRGGDVCWGISSRSIASHKVIVSYLDLHSYHRGLSWELCFQGKLQHFTSCLFPDLCLFYLPIRVGQGIAWRGVA